MHGCRVGSSIRAKKRGRTWWILGKGEVFLWQVVYVIKRGRAGEKIIRGLGLPMPNILFLTAPNKRKIPIHTPLALCDPTSPDLSHLIKLGTQCKQIYDKVGRKGPRSRSFPIYFYSLFYLFIQSLLRRYSRNDWTGKNEERLGFQCVNGTANFTNQTVQSHDFKLK